MYREKEMKNKLIKFLSSKEFGMILSILFLLFIFIKPVLCIPIIIWAVVKTFCSDFKEQNEKY
jgi:hypothetical protein